MNTTHPVEPTPPPPAPEIVPEDWPENVEVQAVPPRKGILPVNEVVVGASLFGWLFGRP